MIVDLNWGITSIDSDIGNNTQNNETSRKRKFDSVENNDHKNHQIYDPLIYTFGKVVHFSADIDKLTIEILIKHISAIINTFYDDYETRGETLQITYVVDSNGGSVSSVLKFVDFLKLAKLSYPLLQFKSVISGLTASAGTIMACVADERVMTSNATAMIHDLSGRIPGTYTQMMSQVEFIKHLNKSLVDIYLQKCNRTRDEIEKLLMTNKWFNAQEYKEYGFIDSIQ